MDSVHVDVLVVVCGFCLNGDLWGLGGGGGCGGGWLRGRGFGLDDDLVVGRGSHAVGMGNVCRRLHGKMQIPIGATSLLHTMRKLAGSWRLGGLSLAVLTVPPSPRFSRITLLSIITSIISLSIHHFDYLAISNYRERNRSNPCMHNSSVLTSTPALPNFIRHLSPPLSSSV